MIEPLPNHKDEWAYYESEPLFDYVCQVSDETVLEINPDRSRASYRCASNCSELYVSNNV